MAEELCCYRCGSSLAALSLPLSRRDECPSCSVYLHVCRMCRFFDPQVPRQCREDDAEDVTEKERQNFCDWFKPAANVFDAGRFGEARQAKVQLDELFGDSDAASKDGDAATSEADDLFK